MLRIKKHKEEALYLDYMKTIHYFWSKDSMACPYVLNVGKIKFKDTKVHRNTSWRQQSVRKSRFVAK